MTYHKSNNHHNFKLWPSGISKKTRIQLNPSGVSIIWGHIEHKWHILTIKISDFLELEVAKQMADEITAILEGTWPMLTLEKALQVWPGVEILNHYEVQFSEDGGKQTAFAPSTPELITYASERGHPIKVTKTLDSWILSTVDGRWHKQTKSTSSAVTTIRQDLQRLNKLDESTNRRPGGFIE